MSSAKELNIILLGETGTGKSLFINSVANYFHFQNLKEAVDSQESVSLISSKFKVIDFNFEEKEITSGENDGNERIEVGESFTVNCKSYKFQLGDVSVRLIDTPGVGDTHGEEADITNVANILSFINNFENLHAIGIIMKNTETKMTSRFTECLKLLLTNLNKSAVDNLVFILTFSRSNEFTPGTIKEVIQKFISNELDGSAFKLTRDRMYCFDNNSYQYLMATNSSIQFDPDHFNSYDWNWKKSSSEMSRLLKHVSQLTPHRVKEMRSLSDARQFLKAIYPFLPELLATINANTTLINKHQQALQMADENVNLVTNNVKLEQIEIKVVQIDEAITFCTSPNCREVVKVGEEESYHFPKQCCPGCIVPNNWRWFCEAIEWTGYCKVCKCRQSYHDRRFFRTDKETKNLFTDEAVSKINEAVSERERIAIAIESMKQRKEQLMKEREKIENAQIKFAKFLQINALVKPPEGQAQSRDGAYYAEKKVNDKYERQISRMECIDIDEFYRIKEVLVNLPINGVKIKEMVAANSRGLRTNVNAKETIRKIVRKFTY